MSKTQSRLGIAIPDKALEPIEYVTLYKVSQTFIEGLGPTKLDFSGSYTIVNNTNGKLLGSVPNDNFTTALSSVNWEVSYGGYASFELGVTGQRIIASVYVNDLEIVPTRQIIVSATDEFTMPFNKTWILGNIPLTNTIDIRFSATVGDITINDFTMTLKSLH